MLNKEIFTRVLCIGNAYLNEGMLDKAWDKYDQALQILTKIADYDNKEEKLKYSSVYDDFGELSKKIVKLYKNIKEFLDNNRDNVLDNNIQNKCRAYNEVLKGIKKFKDNMYPDLKRRLL